MVQILTTTLQLEIQIPILGNLDTEQEIILAMRVITVVGKPYRPAQEVGSIILIVVAIEHTSQNKDSITAPCWS